jgi:hypothetical protein
VSVDYRQRAALIDSGGWTHGGMFWEHPQSKKWCTIPPIRLDLQIKQQNRQLDTKQKPKQQLRSTCAKKQMENVSYLTNVSETYGYPTPD